MSHKQYEYLESQAVCDRLHSVPLSERSSRAFPAGNGVLSADTEEIPFYNEDLDVQPALPPVADLRSKGAGSDGIVIATPKYNRGVPGVLKNALDWASRPAFASCFRGKPVLIISSAPAFTGGVRAQYQLRETLSSMLAHIVPGREVIVAGVNARMSHGRFTDEESLAFIATGLNRLREEVLSQRAVAR
jgi:chromate reductase